ncbi:hypothetical protein SAMN06264364_14418 [Quadrisphaera granulorum]|uniref:Transposase n=1 Tax=Quadrisphaera granulorum TaxID=317664 RepID=A0A315ZQH7_9ACTN|nr:hypothetical protein BXY45_14418 [Quadrisphaera granulorum]SZE99006.1 hypothetical protein SAMN06264364_14418 [Quadrisphaera granulorum]
MDTLNPGKAWRKRHDQHVARKIYSEELRRDAVQLYRTNPHAVVVGIAADLGVLDSTLPGWLREAGVPVHPRPGRSSPVAAVPTESPSEELTRLRARVSSSPWAIRSSRRCRTRKPALCR